MTEYRSALGLRDRVLPLAARGARQQVDRPRRQRHVAPLEVLAHPPSQAHHAAREQRDPDHALEGGPVAVPADGRALAVLGEQHVREGRGLQRREGRRAVAEREQPVRDGRGLHQAGAVEVVPPPEGEHPPAALVAAKLEGFEREPGQPARELALLVGRNEVRLVREALRELGRPIEEGELLGPGHETHLGTNARSGKGPRQIAVSQPCSSRRAPRWMAVSSS